MYHLDCECIIIANLYRRLNDGRVVKFMWRDYFTYKKSHTRHEYKSEILLYKIKYFTSITSLQIIEKAAQIKKQEEEQKAAQIKKHEEDKKASVCLKIDLRQFMLLMIQILLIFV